MRFRQSILWLSSSISLLSAIACLFFTSYHSKLEKRLTQEKTELSQLKVDINKGLASRQYAQSIIQDLASLSMTKPEVQNLLSKIGVVVTPKQNTNP